MISGIGIDTVETARFQRFLDEGNEAILNRLFSPEEQDYCRAKKGAAACLAARFAAKEAFLKALGTGMRNGISWIEIQVRHNHLGKPDIQLSGRAEELFTRSGAERLHLSISHDGGNAVAIVVME